MQSPRSLWARRYMSLTALAVASLSLLVLASTAAADFEFGGTGSAAAQLSNPQALAVDRSNGHVYVGDTGNNRVDVFDSAGNFLSAFGWGVADGTAAEPQACSTTCFAGLEGGGAGEFAELRQIAVDNDPASPSYHDVYTFDGSRVQKFTPAGEFLRAWGGGVITGGAKGTGDLSSGSAMISNVKTTEKAFELGQTVTGSGIPAETKIVAIGPGTITLSDPAGASGTGIPLTVAEGAGHVPVNEKQLLTIGGPGVSYEILFHTDYPSATFAETGTLTTSASAASIQSALAALPNIGAGNVAVIGSPGGPYTIEFKGTRFADTDVALPSVHSVGENSDGTVITTIQNGGSAAELCTPATAGSCAGGVAGSGEGQFDGSGDHLALGPEGNVSVASSKEVGSMGAEAVFANRLQAFSPSGAFSNQFELAGGKSQRVAGLAVDGAGNSYVSLSLSEGALRKYDPAGNQIAVLHPDTDSGGAGGIGPVAVDAAADVFVSGSGTVEYDSAGNLQRVFYNAHGTRAYAPYHSAAGELFVLQGNDKVLYASFPPPGPVFTTFGASASAIGNRRAMLHTSFNPEGRASTYHFQYVDDNGFKAGGFSNPATKATAESDPTEADFKLHEASFEAQGLTPETTYHFRAVATNADGTTVGPEASFKTLPPIEVLGAWATGVGTESAVLHGAVDPKGIAATGYLQYVDDATFQASGFAEATDVPDISQGAQPFDFGAGEGPSAHSAILSSLPLGTTYHFRLIAEDAFGTFPSAPRIFTTFSEAGASSTACPNQVFRSGASATLPDCRAYEMVSPVDKEGGDILAQPSTAGFISRLDQSAGSGEALTYSSYRAFGGAQSSPFTSQYIARRNPGSGWGSEAISPPQQGEFKNLAQIDNPYRSFSTDLETGWLFTNSEPVLGEGGLPGFANLYRRASAGGTYRGCTTTEPQLLTSSEYFPEFQGSSADDSAAVFRVRDKLTSDASSAIAAGHPIYQIYECVFKAGGVAVLQLLNVLPNGSASSLDSTLGVTYLQPPADLGRKDTLATAISADGSRVFWTASSGSEGTGPGSLYVRVNSDQSREGGECAEAAQPCTYLIAEGSRFVGADPAGAKALYLKGEELHEFDVETKTDQLIAGKVPGVLGMSENLSHVYFLSQEATSQERSEGAIEGNPNLYLHEAGVSPKTTFIATLSASDAIPDFFSPISNRPIEHTARVSPDGTHLAFMSNSPALAEEVAGYDNTDVQSGRSDAEVYRYAAGSGNLACVSCNPGGGRPTGRNLGPEGSPIWVASLLQPWENSLYAPRVMSSDGSRIYFESYEPLTSADTNGKADVYEWEEAGSGGCEEVGSSFVKASGGCLSLISSGQSPADSEFVDASPDGRDVFIRTASSLLPQDPGEIDIYDAREEGGFPPPPSAPVECEGQACQSPAAPPNDPTPASSAFEGAGNVKAPAAKKKHSKKKHQAKKNAKKKNKQAKSRRSS
jgi:hypothetical protein